MSKFLAADAKVLGEFRPYLLMLARLQIDICLQAKLDASDVVQLTLLEAHQSLAQFRGTSSSEMASWLRQILARNLSDELSKFKTKKRNITRETSLNAEIDESSLRLERWLEAEERTPCDNAIASEQLIRLAVALLTLPEDQRRAVELHHLQGWRSADVAVYMEKTEESVAGLLRRGLRKLREQMQEKEGKR